MLIGWNGLLLVDTSATDRPVAKHPFYYLNTCKWAIPHWRAYMAMKLILFQLDETFTGDVKNM